MSGVRKVVTCTSSRRLMRCRTCTAGRAASAAMAAITAGRRQRVESARHAALREAWREDGLGVRVVGDRRGRDAGRRPTAEVEHVEVGRVAGTGLRI